MLNPLMIKLNRVSLKKSIAIVQQD